MEKKKRSILLKTRLLLMRLRMEKIKMERRRK